MKYDVTGLGELLIDFTEYGTSTQGNPVLEANPGGAPSNVLSMLAKLGHKTAFIGKVGRDRFGTQLTEALVEVGIDTKGLKTDEEIHTTLAFVHTFPDGDRDFSFYRNPGADMMLREEEVDEDLIRSSKIFHYGSLSMTDDPCLSAQKKAMALAEEAGCILSFDPNLRPPLWRSLEDAHEAIAYGLERCEILKISDNEILWFTGKDDYDEGIAVLQQQYPNIRLIVLSMGPDGSRAYHNGLRVEVPAFVRTDTIETTGAGDTFGACVLHYILENGWRSYNEEELKEMLLFANAAASIVTTRKGALRVMPSREEIETALGR